MIMKFTPKLIVGSVATGVLAAGTGLMAWFSSPSTTRTQDTLAVQDSFQSYSHAAIIPAVQMIPAVDFQRATPGNNYIPVSHWYKDKGWWKRHAPIVGGAAGGGLIGGLAGGGKGALIGGAAGAGGGALYKHLKDKHHHGDAYRSNHGEAHRSTDQPTPKQPQYGR
jgi:hypothetical protein